MFTRHYAGAAPCSPARACLYTGLYQMNNRVCRNGTPLDARHDNIALAAAPLGYDPTLFGYTDVAPDPRRLCTATIRCCKSYEGVLPGFSVRQLLPEHQKPWLSWLAARGVDVSAPDVPASTARSAVRQAASRTAPPVYSQRRDADRLPRRRVHPLARRAGRAPWFAHVSFISPHPPFIVPEPYNTMYDPDRRPGHSRAPETWQAEARQPSLSRLRSSARRTAASFLPGVEGQGARPRTRRVPQHPRDLLRHDLGGRRPARPHLASVASDAGAGTTRSSS